MLRWDDAKYSSKKQIPDERFDISRAPIHAKTACCQCAPNLTGREKITVAEVRVTAGFRDLHTPAQFPPKE